MTIRSTIDATASVAMILTSGVILWKTLGAAPVATRTGSAGQPINVEASHFELRPRQGKLTATPGRVVIVEFSDFQCPFCGQFATSTLPEIRRKLVDTGKVEFVFVNFPLDSIHPFATEASQAAECADDQHRFWDLHNALFSNQRRLEHQTLVTTAHSLGLDDVAFSNCLTSAGAAARVKADVAEGERLGVDSTPTFFVGRTGSNGRVRLLRRISGAAGFGSFETALSELGP